MRKNRKYTQQEMFALIRKWEASGVSQEKYFKDNGIAKSTFGFWRKKYLQEQKGATGQERNFIPVKIDAPVEEVDQKAESFIELHYPNGVRLTCSGEIDLSRLKTLIIL
jgi:transposase-like protein